jgi:hypothetical protein
MEPAPEAARGSAGRSAFVATGAVVLLAAITWTDYLTGYELGFFVFYFIPVSIAAWYLSRRWGVAFGFAGAFCWFLSDRLGDHQYSRAWYAYWETAVRLVSFLTIAFTVAAIREALARERKLVAELSDSLAQVRQLEGLIPICAWCRRIRDDAGYWERFEAYLSTRTGARFTHGICPSCYERMGAGEPPPGPARANPSSRPG